MILVSDAQITDLLKVAADAIWIDVRSPEEFATGAVQGALLIPVDQLGEQIAEHIINREQRLYLYCRSGVRSEVAVQILQAQGYTQAYNLGGFAQLVAQGLPTENFT